MLEIFIILVAGVSYLGIMKLFVIALSLKERVNPIEIENGRLLQITGGQRDVCSHKLFLIRFSANVEAVALSPA